MLGDFRNQFEKLLYSEPLSYVDVMPLVLKFIKGMNDDREAIFRVHANNYFRELQREGFVVLDTVIATHMFGHIGGQPRSTEPVLIKATDKFIRYYEDKNRTVANNITNNYNTTYGPNSPIAGRDVNIGERVNSNMQPLTSIDRYMPDFKIEKRETFNKEYLKVFLRDKTKFRTIRTLLSGLQSVKNVNITENNETDLTVYPSKLYTAEETAKELEVALNSYFTGSPIDPKIEDDGLSHISDKAYFQILDKISNYGRNLEKYKDLYDKFDEEGFRNFFLPYLNSISTNHTATGETFNKIGKTDILIQDENGNNVFIAECKLWKGEGEIENAINQLLERYVTWRDEKVAVIFFNKTVKKFGDVIEKAINAFKVHKNFKQYIGKRGETSHSFIFTNPDDPGRMIKLELMLFNCV
jgi:hypothetical protein